MKVDLLKDMHVFKLLLYALVVLVKGKKRRKKTGSHYTAAHIAKLRLLQEKCRLRIQIKKKVV